MPIDPTPWPAAVVFDLDGTLVDSAVDIAASLNDLLAERRLEPYPVDQAVTFVGCGIRALVDRAFSVRGCSLDAQRLSTLVAEYRAVYRWRSTETTKAYAGAMDALSTLRLHGTRVGICTNKDEDIACRIIDAVGLRNYVDAVVGGITGRPAKPSPIPLLETITRLGASPADSIMVGDSATDIHCARNANVPFIGVTFGYSDPPMSQLGADATIDSYAEFEGACKLLQNRFP